MANEEELLESYRRGEFHYPNTEKSASWGGGKVEDEHGNLKPRHPGKGSDDERALMAGISETYQIMSRKSSAVGYIESVPRGKGIHEGRQQEIALDPPGLLEDAKQEKKQRGEPFAPEPMNRPSHSPANLMLRHPKFDMKVVRLLPIEEQRKLWEEHTHPVRDANGAPVYYSDGRPKLYVDHWQLSVEAYHTLQRVDEEKWNDLNEAYKRLKEKVAQDRKNEMRNYFAGMLTVEPGPPGIQTGELRRGADYRIYQTDNGNWYRRWSSGTKEQIQPPKSKIRNSRKPGEYINPTLRDRIISVVHGQATRETVSGLGVLDEARQLLDEEHYWERVAQRRADKEAKKKEREQLLLEEASRGNPDAQQVLYERRKAKERKEEEAIQNKIKDKAQQGNPLAQEMARLEGLASLDEG